MLWQSGSELLCQFPERHLKVAQRGIGSLAGHEDEVDAGRQLVLGQSKRLTQEPLPAIPHDRTAMFS